MKSKINQWLITVILSAIAIAVIPAAFNFTAKQFRGSRSNILGKPAEPLYALYAKESENVKYWYRNVNHALGGNYEPHPEWIKKPATANFFDQFDPSASNNSGSAWQSAPIVAPPAQQPAPWTDGPLVSQQPAQLSPQMAAAPVQHQSSHKQPSYLSTNPNAGLETAAPAPVKYDRTMNEMAIQAQINALDAQRRAYAAEAARRANSWYADYQHEQEVKQQQQQQFFRERDRQLQENQRQLDQMGRDIDADGQALQLNAELDGIRSAIQNQQP